MECYCCGHLNEFEIDNFDLCKRCQNRINSQAEIISKLETRIEKLNTLIEKLILLRDKNV